jgi:hypothetical protein
MVPRARDRATIGGRIKKISLERGQNPVRLPATRTVGSRQSRARRRLESRTLRRNERSGKLKNQCINVDVSRLELRYCHNTASVKWLCRRYGLRR